MPRFLTTLAVAALVLIVASPAFSQDAAKLDRGKAVYAEQKCRMCHSVGEEGNKKGPLDGVGSRLSADDLKQWIVNATGMAEKAKAERKPKMKNYATLSAEDVDALVAYMQSLKRQG